MAEVNPPWALQNSVAHTAEIARSFLTGLLTGGASGIKGIGGVHPDIGSRLAVAQAGSPNMSVDVSTGLAFIQGTEGAKQGIYLVLNDATKNIAIAASDPTNPRIDLICFKVQDQAYSGATNSSSIVAVTGTPAGSPSPPTAPANSITLAQIAVGANVTSIVNANITDLRNPYAAGLRGVIRTTSAFRPTWVGNPPGAGQLIFETDTKKVYVWDTSIWAEIRKVSDDLRFMGETVNASSNVTFTTTETAGPTFTITAVSTDRYLVLANSAFESSVTGDLIIARIRYKNAGSLSSPPSTDTELVKQQLRVHAGGGPSSVTLFQTVTGLTGTYTFGLTGVRSAGTGTCQFNGAAANNSEITLDVLKVT